MIATLKQQLADLTATAARLETLLPTNGRLAELDGAKMLVELDKINGRLSKLASRLTAAPPPPQGRQRASE
jgi:hypothetical protein